MDIVLHLFRLYNQFTFLKIRTYRFCTYDILDMIQSNNNSVPLGKCGSFCSECNLFLNSIYSIGSASSLNECKSFIGKESKDCNSPLNECAQTLNEEIIKKIDDKFNHPQFSFFCENKLSSLVAHTSDKYSITSEKKIQTLPNHFKKVQNVEESKKFKEIYIPNNYKKYSTRVKPTIIEDKILQSSEQLKINNRKRQKNECSNSKDSAQSKTLKYVNTDHIKYQNITNSCTDLKNEYGVKRQSEKLTQIPTYPKFQNTENEAHAVMESEYLSQYNILKSTILNRRKRVSNIAQNLLTLSTYLDGICKTILETGKSNTSTICPKISYNLYKKEDKNTSPILVSKTPPAVTNLIPYEGNTHDMYSYNPYRTKNILKKKT